MLLKEILSIQALFHPARFQWQSFQWSPAHRTAAESYPTLVETRHQESSLPGNSARDLEARALPTNNNGRPVSHYSGSSLETHYTSGTTDSAEPSSKSKDRQSQPLNRGSQNSGLENEQSLTNPVTENSKTDTIPTSSVQSNSVSQQSYEIAPRKMRHQPSSRENLARIDEIKAKTIAMGNHDLRNLLQSDVRLCSAAAHLLQDNLKANHFDKCIPSIGNDYCQWEQLVEKHPNMQRFVNEYQKNRQVTQKGKSREKTASHKEVLARKNSMKELRKRKRSGLEKDLETGELSEDESFEERFAKKARVKEWRGGLDPARVRQVGSTWKVDVSGQDSGSTSS